MSVYNEKKRRSRCFVYINFQIFTVFEAEHVDTNKMHVKLSKRQINRDSKPYNIGTCLVVILNFIYKCNKQTNQEICVNRISKSVLSRRNVDARGFSTQYCK